MRYSGPAAACGGPTSALAITVATSVVAIADGDLFRAIALASALALIVGMVCIAGRFVGLANIAYFISDAILVGFKTGAALYIASTQLPKLFGIEGITGNVFERFGHVLVSLHETHVPSLVVGLAAIALFVSFGRIFPGRPTTVCRCRGHCSDERVRAGRDRHQDRRRNPHRPAGNQRAERPSIRISALVPIALACVLLPTARRFPSPAVLRKSMATTSAPSKSSRLSALQMLRRDWLRDFPSQAGCRRPPSMIWEEHPLHFPCS